MKRDDDKYSKDQALKALYDESVTFKNSLAQLRSSIKTLNAQFNSYDLKCNKLINNEFHEYSELKNKIEAEKNRIEESEVL